MKKLYIAPFDCTIYIYGNSERKRFDKEFTKTDDGDYARTCGNGVWIGEHDELIGVCYHEAVHLVDWVLEERLRTKQGKLRDNTEIRAYLTEYIGNAIRRYCCEG